MVFLQSSSQGCSSRWEPALENCRRCECEWIMPRYIVERSIPCAGDLTAGELRSIAQQILRVQRNMEAEIQWIHSMITADRMVCLYIADDEEIVREHARLSGLPISRICEVSAVFGPAMNDLD